MADEKALWYVVHTYSGYENKVANDLVKTVENNGMGDLIQEVTVPIEEVVEIRNGKPHTIQHKLFPGYVLVKMIKTTETWYVVRNTRGVTGFVGPGSEPIPLTDEEYERMTSCQGTIRIDLEPGDNVRIKTGSVENAIGTVEEINAEEHKVKVSIEILNRKTTVEYDISEVERLYGGRVGKTKQTTPGGRLRLLKRLVSGQETGVSPARFLAGRPDVGGTFCSA